MNNALITSHIYFGGLKRRLQYANYAFLILQVLLFLYSSITLIRFDNIISLFIILFVFSFFNLLTSIILFMLIRRSYRRENPFMLSIRRMETHVEEYYQDYLSKNNIKQIIQNN